MKKLLATPFLAASLAAALLPACGPADEEAEFEKADDYDGDGKADSSAEATILDFEFDGEVLTTSAWSREQTVRDQLLYTIGQLNGSRSVGRLDRLELSALSSSDAGGGKTLIKYHAKMPVAWGSKTNLPTSYEFKLPRDVSYDALETFTNKYKHDCVDFGAHDVDSGSLWYYWRPENSGCAITDTELAKIPATAVVSTVNTTGKFPEYHKVWEDNELRVVAIFGKYEDGATTGDAGIDGFNAFVAGVKNTLTGEVTIPATVPANPGVSTPDITFTADLPGGRKVTIVALLVDNVRTAGPSFDARYTALSTRADLIIYNGHAGLGQNVRALAQKGSWVAGQYMILFMNGCDTFAYVDGSLAQARKAVNPDDPTGTKYMEFVTNAMPSYFSNMPNASLALIKALLKVDAPTTYEQMFRQISSTQVVLVTGEQDNVYVPGFPGGGGGGGGGGTHLLNETTSAGKGQTLAFETSEQQPGTYTVIMAHDAANPGGDADLYVKVGSAPTTTSYACRPYQAGSDERCEIVLAAAAKIYINVNGYGDGENHFVLTVDKIVAAPPPGGVWAGLDESATLAKSAEKRWQTPVLAAGTYLFTMTGTGGDADLYVRIGTAPTSTTYDCRPYKSGSNESCQVTLASPSAIHVMVRGYATTSTFRLVGKKL